jgi:predicted alpha-1,6-mannanase (GH76 family)
VHVDVVVIESDDMASAVAEEITKDGITKLVVGASSGGLFKRYLLKHWCITDTNTNTRHDTGTSSLISVIICIGKYFR